MVFQQATLLPWRTVTQNVLLPIETLRRDMRQGKERAAELVRLVGLEQFANHYPHELSGGMQQRVGIARGLVHDPNLLLMDEPFAALDAMTREYMMIELQRIWLATAKSIVFITHSIPEAVFLADRILVLSERPGRVIRNIEVDIPRPRTTDTMSMPRFGELCRELRSLFMPTSDGGGSRK
jgi:NitT/TauT family transport system ATP-binding protein